MVLDEPPALLQKMAGLMTLVGMLLQTKVYLFWSKKCTLRQNASMSTV